MADNTKIEWASATWSPITGCTTISEGCQNCYAKRMSKRLAGRFGYPKDDPFKVTFHPDRLEQPLKWQKPRRIFVCSMGDLFHKDVKISQLNAIFNAISRSWELNFKHTFLILTKRPRKMQKYIEEHRHYETAVCYYDTSNVWLGITAENQKRADERIPILLQIPAAVRFVSIEPMLSQVNMDNVLNSFFTCNGKKYDGHCCESHDVFGHYFKGIDWVICGAETGPGKRKMETEWAVDLKNQCVDAGVPFFFKVDSDGNRKLDGRLWEQYPERII